MHLENKVAIITGSGRGIGKGIAMFLASQGAKIVVNDPGSAQDGSGEDAGPAQQTANEIIKQGGIAIANFDSIADYDSAGNLINQAINEWGTIDILVNCAGILRDRMIFNMTKEEWDAVLKVHLYGHFNTISQASKVMKINNTGSIINFTSNSGLLGNIGQVNYGAAKAGIAGLTRVTARDLQKYNITVNAISPVAETRMTEGVDGQGKSNKKTSIFAGMKAPEQVAPMVGYLASESAKKITGKIFYVQGGRVSIPFHPTPEHTIYSSESRWSLENLDDGINYVLLRKKRNPVPPAEDIIVPGRDSAAKPLNTIPLKNKTFIITGAAGGIGKEIAKELASHGANLILNDPGVQLDGTKENPSLLKQLADELIANNYNAIISKDDITQWEGANNLINSATEQFQTLDGVIHAAGILQDKMIFNMTADEWHNVIKVHLTSYFNLVKHASIIMKKQNFGRLIGFTSSAGLNGNAGQANYGAAKAGIAGMTRCLAIDLGKIGITANAIAPTAITRMTESVPKNIKDKKINYNNATFQSNYNPNQIAPLVAYLCSEQAWNINGKVFYSAGKKVSIAHDILPFRSINKPELWTIDELAELVPNSLLDGLDVGAN